MKILSFDIEEWFHILDNEKTKSILEWNKFDSRLKLGMDIIHQILENSNELKRFIISKNKQILLISKLQKDCTNLNFKNYFLFPPKWNDTPALAIFSEPCAWA